MSYTDLITVENFGLYGDIHKRELTEEEKASTPYSKFYDLPVQLPSEDNIMALLPDHEIDPALSFTPAECEKLFAPGYLECENGYCVRPDGYGFSAVNIKMPRVTPEMLDFWFNWYPQNPVHYMTWLPGMHVNSSAGPVADENLGWGTVGLDRGVNVILPPTYGIEDPTSKDPDFIRFFGGSMNILNLDIKDEKNPPRMTMVNYIRKCGSGIEYRVRVWMGVYYMDDEIQKETCDYPISLAFRTRMMACHNAWEWSRMSELLPEVYKFAKENGLD